MILRYLLLLFAVKLLAADYAYPPGVPPIPWGLTNSHWHLTNYTYNFGTGAVAYPIGPSGPYTHVINNLSPSATDTANPYGTHAIPRMTIPDGAAPTFLGTSNGHIVEIHGGPYVSGNGGANQFYWSFSVTGTNFNPDRPTYFRGTNWLARPMIDASAQYISTRYVIWENLTFTNTQWGGVFSVRGNNSNDNANAIQVSYLCFRSNEVASYGGNLGNGGAFLLGDSSSSSAILSNMVIWNNWVHNIGTTNQSIENDQLGVKVLSGVYHVWIGRNHIHHMGGDGVSPGVNQYGSAYNHGDWFPGAVDAEGRWCYIFDNLLHHNGENSVDIKVHRDVVVSRNNCYSNWQHAIVGHYSGENHWYLANWIHDNNANGVHNPAGISNTGEDDAHYGGNLFTDLDSAIEITSAASAPTWNNTFIRCASGPYAAFGTNRLVNNLFYQGGSDMNYETASANLSYGSNNWIFPIPFSATWISEYTTKGALEAGAPFKNTGTNNPILIDYAGNNFALSNSSPALTTGLQSFSLFKSNESFNYFGAGTPIADYPGEWGWALSLLLDTNYPNGNAVIGPFPPPRTARANAVRAGRVQ